MADDDPKTIDGSETTAVELASVRREIDILKTVVKKPARPWYRDGSLLLAAVAFLFSLFTFYRQDQNDTQVELRNVLKDIYTLPQVDAETRSKFKGNDESRISSALNHQNHVLTLQAYALAEHLGRSLSNPERTAVAEAIAPIEPALALKMLTEAPISSDDVDDFIGAQRMLGALQIRLKQQTDLGDANFRAAEDILKSVEHVDLGYQGMSNTLTESAWSQAYLTIGNCQTAVLHLKAAQDWFNRIAGAPAAEMARPQLEFQIAATRAGCPAFNGQ